MSPEPSKKRTREKRGKVKAVKKPYGLEWRASKEGKWSNVVAWFRWSMFGRYETRADMLQAWLAGKKKWGDSMEFREQLTNPKE